MKRLFSFSLQNRFIFVLLLFINIPFVLTGYMTTSMTEKGILREKEDKLMALAKVLDTYLGPGGYDALLREHHAEQADKAEKIAVLNKALSDATDKVGMASSGLGIGFYSRELDAILTYGPSSLFSHTIGVAIPPGHPGQEVMATGKPLARFGTMVRGDILNAMIPVERGGRVIGYIWANELSTDILNQVNAMARNILLIMFLCFVLTFCLLLLLSRRTVSAVDDIISGVRLMRGDLTQRIEGVKGELGDVAANINAMAADIANANEETNRAITVLRNVLNNVDAAVYVCDPQNYELVYCNEYLLKILDCHELQGQTCYKALYNSSAPCSFCPHERLLSAIGAQASTPVRRELHEKHSGRHFLVTDRLVTWQDGRLLHLQFAADVTDRKALALAEEANLAQREFLARMSHEIRTPMNGVLGMTRLAMQASPPPAQLEYLKKIQSSASLLLGIINDILDFSRIEAGKLVMEKHSFNLHEMVGNLVELILPRTKEQNLNFIVDMDASVPEYAYGDDLRLAQVLINLLGNAAKFTLEGSISLTIRATSSASDSFTLHCEVKDTGIGMNPEQLSSLFRPFTQADSSTSRRFGGTGLGLSICKALVELMGGSISVTSKEGNGCVFIFFVELEQIESAPEHHETREELWENARYEGHVFLLVEDNVINQEIAEAILTDLGARVEIAGNGKEAVAAFLQNDYSLILMDVRMPIMDGLEATRLIRASAKHDAVTVPILAMTANAMLHDREISKTAGMNGHIAKPVEIDELKSSIFQFVKSTQTIESP